MRSEEEIRARIAHLEKYKKAGEDVGDLPGAPTKIPEGYLHHIYCAELKGGIDELKKVLEED